MKLDILFFVITIVKCAVLETKTQKLAPFYFSIHNKEQSSISIPPSIFSQYRAVFNFDKIDEQNDLSKYCQFKHHNIDIQSHVLQKINRQVDGNFISFFTFKKYVVAITDKYRIIQFAIENDESNNGDDESKIKNNQNSNNNDANNSINNNQNTDSNHLLKLETVNRRITRIFENVIPLPSQGDIQQDAPPLFGYSNEKTIHIFFKKKSFYMKISSFNIYEVKENYVQRENMYRLLSLSENEMIIASGKDGLDYYKVNALDNTSERYSYTHRNIQLAQNNDIQDIIFLLNNSTNPIFAVVDFTKTIYIIDHNFLILFSIKDVPPQVTRITSSSSSLLLAIGKNYQGNSYIREYIIDLSNKSYSLNRQYTGDDEAWNEVFADKYMSFVLGKYRSRIFFHGINKAFLSDDEIESHNTNLMIDQNVYKDVRLAFRMPILEDLLIFAITPDEILSLEISQLQNQIQCYSDSVGEGKFQLQLYSTECDALSQIEQGYQMCNSILDVAFDVSKVYIDSKNLSRLIILIVFSILFFLLLTAIFVIYIIKKHKKQYQQLIQENNNIAQKYLELENQSQYITKSSNNQDI